MGKKGPRNTKALSDLTNVMEVSKRPLKAMKGKYTETRQTIGKLIAEKEKLHESYLEDVKDVDCSIQKQLQQICNDHELMNSELQRHEKELKTRSIKFQNCEVAIRMERNKLADAHKREMEKLQEKISYLEKQVKDGNQNLLLEREHLLGQLNAISEHRRYHQVKARKKIEDIVTSLNEKEEERKGLEILSQNLVSQDQKNDDELQDAWHELIKVQQAMDGNDERLKCLQNATILEGVSCLLKIWKEQKRKKIWSYFEFE